MWRIAVSAGTAKFILKYTQATSYIVGRVGGTPFSHIRLYTHAGWLAARLAPGSRACDIKNSARARVVRGDRSRYKSHHEVAIFGTNFIFSTDP